MNVDIVNGTLYVVAAVLTGLSVRRTMRVGGTGVHWATVLFFVAWGLWTIYFYADLLQWWSAFGAASLLAVNTMWLILLLRSRKPISDAENTHDAQCHEEAHRDVKGPVTFP